MHLKYPRFFFTLMIPALFASHTFAATNNCERALLGIPETVEELGISWREAHWRGDLRPFRFYNYKALKKIIEDDDLAEVAGQWMRMSSFTNNREFAEASYQFLVSLADMRVKFNLPMPAGRPPMLDYLSTVIHESTRSVGFNSAIDVELMKKTNQYFHIDIGLLNLSDKEALIKIANDEIIPRYHHLKMAQAFLEEWNSAQPTTELESDLLLLPNGVQLYRAKLAESVVELQTRDGLFVRKRLVRGIITGLKKSFLEPIILEMQTAKGKVEIPVDDIEPTSLRILSTF